MNKINPFSIILIFSLSCSKSSQKNYDYKTALQHVKEEIKKRPGSVEVKAHLLSKIDLIINEDDHYNKTSLLRDSLRKKYTSEQINSKLINQLNFNTIEDFILQDRIEVYKFKYSRAFLDEKVEITIANQDSFYSLKTQIYKRNYDCNEWVRNGESFSDCYTILMNEQRIISQVEWNQFKALIENARFWEMEKEDGRQGFDGSVWLVEGSREGYLESNTPKQIYKLVYRWSPEDSDPFKSIGLYLLKFSGKDFGEIY